MKKCLKDIYHIDKQMIQNHQVTCENHEQLLITLKKINTIIQNASRLRSTRNILITQGRNTFPTSSLNFIEKKCNTSTL